MFQRLAIAATLGITLIGCTQPRPSSPPSGTTAHALDAQGAWRLQSATDAIGRELLPRGVDYRLQFSDDRINVLGGCNRMFGNALIDGHALKIGPLASTRMACEGPKMQQDATLAKLIEQPLAITLEGQSERLRLKAANGDVLVFSAIPLE